jgi:hypothetical protein
LLSPPFARKDRAVSGGYIGAPNSTLRNRSAREMRALSRLLIAAGAAQGIVTLHSECSPADQPGTAKNSENTNAQASASAPRNTARNMMVLSGGGWMPAI